MKGERFNIKAKGLLKEFTLDKNLENLPISSLSLDSRKLSLNGIFFAMKGKNQDGNKFIDEAFKKGASIILSDQQNISRGNIIYVPKIREYLGTLSSRLHGHPTKKLKVFCVTGTNGKTSCVEAISNLLSLSGISCGYLSTIGVSIDGMEKIEDSYLTTPDSIYLQKVFAQMVREEVNYVALEVSSHGLSQSRIYGTEVDTAILTSFSQDHMDFHKSKKNYELAKRTLFVKYNPNNVILNIDNSFGFKLYKELKVSSEDVFSVSQHHSADFVVDFKRRQDGSLEAFLESSFGSGSFLLKTVSRDIASNVICAFASLLIKGFKFDDLSSASEKLSFPVGRMELHRINKKNSCFVDFAHTPEALSSSLTELKYAFKGKLWCIFGCGGERDSVKRPIMGAIAENLSDEVIITNDNPRNENEDKIIKEILSGMKDPKKAQIIKDRKKAIDKCLTQILGSGEENILLIAGKGHEKYQHIGGRKYSFSDNEVVLAFLGNI